MKTVANAINVAILALTVQVAQAGPVYKTIDDFNTGPQAPVTVPQQDFQPGTMLGGGRHVVYKVGQISPSTPPLNRKGMYTITDGHLIVEDGVHVASRLEISYGIAKNNNVVPLNLEPK